MRLEAPAATVAEAGGSEVVVPAEREGPGEAALAAAEVVAPRGCR